jgi:hypothetical protein
MDLLNKVATTALLGFAVSSMMAMGVGFTVRQIIDALRDVRLVLLGAVEKRLSLPLLPITLYWGLGGPTNVGAEESASA